MSKNINRFKFSQHLIKKIKLFCENNTSLNNDNFKKKYQQWKFENTTIINSEKDLLLSNGYSGNFENKLNKAVLYYFKYNFSSSKLINCEKECEKKCEKECESKINNNIKRQYLLFEFEFLELIDEHIKRHFKSEYKIKSRLLFENFKLVYNYEIINQKNKLKYFINNEETLDNKVKKTYQNRYFNINKKFIL